MFKKIGDDMKFSGSQLRQIVRHEFFIFDDMKYYEFIFLIDTKFSGSQPVLVVKNISYLQTHNQQCEVLLSIIDID